MRVLIILLFLFSSSSVFANYNNLIEKYSNRFKVDIKLVKAVIKIESAYKHKAIGPDAYGDKSSYGLMQLQIATAKDIGYKGNIDDLYVPEVNIAFGIKYLKQCLEWANNNVYEALDMYNRGVGMVRKYPYYGDYRNHNYVGKIIHELRKEY